jgi:hypothetical protein
MRLPMKREISSYTTTFYSRFAPGLVYFFLAVILSLFVFNAESRALLMGEAAMTWVVLAAGVVASLINGNLKVVRIDGENLEIVGWRGTIRVSLFDIDTVELIKGLRPRRMRISFRTTTPFGKRIYFIPRDEGAALAELRRYSSSMRQRRQGS